MKANYPYGIMNQRGLWMPELAHYGIKLLAFWRSNSLSQSSTSRWTSLHLTGADQVRVITDVYRGVLAASLRHPPPDGGPLHLHLGREVQGHPQGPVRGLSPPDTASPGEAERCETAGH